MKLKFITEKEYEAYLFNKENISIQMRTAMVNMLVETGWQCHYIGLVDNERIVGTAVLCGKPMKFAGMFYTCQYGPHLDYTNKSVMKEFFKQLPSILKQLKTTKFEFNPNLIWKQYSPDGVQMECFEYPSLSILEELGYSKQDLSINTNGMWNMRFHYVKTLDYSDDTELLKSYNSQAKKSVKKAKQNGIIIEELAYTDTKVMHTLMEMSAKKHGFSARDFGYYERANKYLKDNAMFIAAKLNVEEYLKSKRQEIVDSTEKIERLHGTKKEKQIPDIERKIESLNGDIDIIENSKDIIDGEIVMSAGVFLINGSELIYLFGGNDGTYQKFCSSFALQHYVMEKGIKLGLSEYNMYGVDGTFDGTDNVLRFKSNFGGHINEFIGTYEYVLKPGKLKRASAIKRLMGR